jgi:hypothetical protein
VRAGLARVIRDLNRKIGDWPELELRFRTLLDLAIKVRHQDHRQRGPKVHSLLRVRRGRAHQQRQGLSPQYNDP